MKLFGYVITIRRIKGKFPTGRKARRKLAQRVEDTRQEPRPDRFGDIFPKIQRIKRARELTFNVGLKETKPWVEIAFLDNGQGEIA